VSKPFGTNPVDVQVGNNVMAIRTKLGLSQDHIAGKLGLNLTEYKEYESGGRRFGPERLLRLARLFGVEAPAFFDSLPTLAGAKFFN
jgi:transcriptional regulator with XRE-family HTH domain